VSVGSVAVELAEKIFSTLQGRQVMVAWRGEHQRKNRALAPQPWRAQHHRLQPLLRPREALAKELGAAPFISMIGPRNSPALMSSSAAPRAALHRGSRPA